MQNKLFLYHPKFQLLKTLELIQLQKINKIQLNQENKKLQSLNFLKSNMQLRKSLTFLIVLLTDIIQSGVIKVVKIINKIDIPSIPTL